MTTPGVALWPVTQAARFLAARSKAGSRAKLRASEVAEPLIQHAGPRVALLHTQLGPVQAAGTDSLLCSLDEKRADPAGLQRPCTASCHSVPAPGVFT
jgi:hypothetical protein